MKTSINVLFLCCLSLFLVQPVHAQLLKKLKEKVEEKVEQRVEQKTEEKVDEAIDKQLDKLDSALEENKKEDSGTNPAGQSKDEKQQKRMQNILKGMGMSGEPVPVADSYNFTYLVEMHLESFDKNGKKEDEGEFVTHLNPETKNMAYEMISGDVNNPGQGMFIIDTQNQAIILLGEDNEEKTGIVYGMGSFFNTLGETYEAEEEIAESPETFLSNPNIKKTGKTKTIAGYTCEEYRYNDEYSESSFWITKDMKMNTRDYFSTLFKTSLYSQGIPWGYMMEVTTTGKETGEKSFMQVTRVEENTHTKFSLGDYQITNLGNIQMPSGSEDEPNHN